MESEGYRVEFIAGGVVKDADGNIISDSGPAALEKLKTLGLPNIMEED